MKTNTRAHIAVILTNLFFSANYTLVKYISPSLIKPYALNVLRVGICVILFWLVWLVGKISGKTEDRSAGIRKEDIFRFFLCGLMGIAVNQSLFVKGLTLTSAIHASLLILCTPLLITIFAFWVLKEKLTLMKAAGLALGIGGSVLLILSKENKSHAEHYLLGDTLIILNAISYAAYFILVRPLMLKYPPIHGVRWIFTIGFIMILPFGWNQTTEIVWTSFHWSQIASLAFVIVAGTFLAYFFNVYGIRHLGAGITGSYIYTQPLLAAIIAMLFLNEQLTIQKIIAAVLIFFGVFFVSFRKS